MSRSNTGLARFGVTPPSIVREPATDGEGVQICAECGHPVSRTKGSQTIANPDIVDRALRQALGAEVVTHGWRCENHSYEVVMPSLPGQLPDGWSAVQVVFSDGHERLIPVPERELEATDGGESE